MRRLLLVAGLLAAATALLVWAFQPYQVVGRSMEPSLVEGDWVYLGRRAPERGDVVVFREPGSERLAVKRVAATPGERVQLLGGEVYLDGQLQRRPLHGVEDLVPLVDAEGAELGGELALDRGGFEHRDDGWHLPGEGYAFLRNPPRDDYLLRGRRVEGELPAVGLGIEARFTLLDRDAELHLVLRKGQSRFLAVLREMGTVAEVRRLDGAEGRERVLFEQRVDASRPQGSLFFSLADQGITLVLNGEPLVSGQAIAPPVPHVLSEVPAEFGRSEHAGVGGRGPLVVSALRVGRDVLYGSGGTHGVGEALQLTEGQYFLLGDNPIQSRDSRHYGAVPEDAILGTVEGRAWPQGWNDRGWDVD